MVEKVEYLGTNLQCSAIGMKKIAPDRCIDLIRCETAHEVSRRIPLSAIGW
jgi:hypothetical protein